MSMYTITDEVTENVKELKKMLFGLMGDESTIMSMDSKAIKTIQLCTKLVDNSCNLMNEYANILHDQNMKLGMILEKLEKKA